MKPQRTAIGTWSGGRFMHFGEDVGDERLVELLRPGSGIETVMTADAYGAGEADSLLGRALAGMPRDTFSLIGAVGHDFYEGERQGAKGFPRFTDPGLRDENGYADFLRMATESSLERIGVSEFDLLLLHNPDFRGYTSESVWDAMASLRDEGLAAEIGVAPGPANGFTLDLIRCFERFGELIDWAMVILNPFEPWPASLCLDAAAESSISVITRVVDYGGIFWDDLTPETLLGARDHRAFRPPGWIEAGRERLERLRPICGRADLTPLQLACHWNLAQPAVESVVPTLIQEAGPDARPIEDKRAELAALPADQQLSPADVEEIRRIGDNSNCMALKGASPEHEGDELPDRWALTDELVEAGVRWNVDPDRDLRQLHPAGA